jgi:hypothetical protein
MAAKRKVKEMTENERLEQDMEMADVSYLFFKCVKAQTLGERP